MESAGKGENERNAIVVLKRPLSRNFYMRMRVHKIEAAYESSRVNAKGERGQLLASFFFSVSSNDPEVFAKVNSAQFFAWMVVIIFATLETKRELEPKCVPQFVLGS